MRLDKERVSGERDLVVGPWCKFIIDDALKIVHMVRTSVRRSPKLRVPQMDAMDPYFGDRETAFNVFNRIAPDRDDDPIHGPV